MRLGMFMMPLHDVARDTHTALMEDVEIAVHCDELGFDEFWMGEHYACKTEPVPAPMIFLANLIARTKNMKLGTGVINLPLAHPAAVASHIALLDHLSEGRLLFGIGPGGLVADLEMFGAGEPEQWGSKMHESIDMILKLWSRDAPFDIEGKHWHIKLTENILDEFGVGVISKPFQKPHPPIANPAMSPHSGSMRAAGEKGWIPISSNLIPTYSVASQWQKYVEGCAAAGRDADPQIWRVSRTIFVADSDDEAEEYVQREGGCLDFYYTYVHGLLTAMNLLHVLKPDPDMADDEFTAEFYLRDNLIHGSPDTVVEKLLALRDEVGDFGTLVIAALEYQDRARIRNSMTLIANAVMPKLRGAIGRAAAAQ